MPRITKAMLEEELECYRRETHRLREQKRILLDEIRMLRNTNPTCQIITATMSLNETAREMMDMVLAVGKRR